MYLKLVDLNDAPYIAELRSNTGINKYLSSQEPISIDQQAKWIEQYLRHGGEYYFIIKGGDVSYGTISMYNIEDEAKRGEFGRFVCTHPVYALAGELMIIEYAFETLKLDEIYCRTISENEKVWKQHYQFGFKDTGEELADDGRTLKVQSLIAASFRQFNYQPIKNIINRFVDR